MNTLFLLLALGTLPQETLPRTPQDMLCPCAVGEHCTCAPGECDCPGCRCPAGTCKLVARPKGPTRPAPAGAGWIWTEEEGGYWYRWVPVSAAPVFSPAPVFRGVSGGC